MTEARASIINLDDGIFAIDTEYARPMQDASHLIVENGRAAFVDTGANNAVPLLLDALKRQNLAPADVDYLFLTHVHLDHAGGAGLLMRALPNAICVLHPRGAPHMIDPSRLIAGTEAVYGKKQAQEIYGVIEPIDEARIRIAGNDEWFDLNGRALQTIYTEGHAKHHYVLNDPQSRGVFTGDSFGVSYRELDTAAGPFIFPTTTPIDFDPDAAHVAYDRIMACDPAHVYLTHYSKVADLDRLVSDLHSGIDAFRFMALDAEQSEDRLQQLRRCIFGYLAERLAQHGYDGDEDAMWAVLSIDVDLNAQGLDVWLKRREKSTIANS
ncbi:MAG TPA: MBL fold metallo-hydrolase [Woeseiaceae bacterium]|nr:MBL fold metallo-hydrolase [Woeseiaceae bacterium]